MQLVDSLLVQDDIVEAGRESLAAPAIQQSVSQTFPLNNQQADTTHFKYICFILRALKRMSSAERRPSTGPPVRFES